MENHLIRYLLTFGELPGSDQQTITAAFETCHVKQGVYLSKAGELIDEIYFINSGILKYTLPRNEEERDITYYFMKEHQFAGFLYSLYNGVPAETNLMALVDAELLVINQERLLALFEQIPYLRRTLDSIAQFAMVDMVNTRNTYLGSTSARRYQLFLEKQPEIARLAPLIDVASYLGITPQSLSRIRNGLARK